MENKIGENRLIPKGTKFWSTNNLGNIMLDEDAIVTITHTCIGSDRVVVEQKQLIFNMRGHIPKLIRKGRDEWMISYSDTLPYTVPEPKF